MFLLAKKKFLFESALIFICSFEYKLLGQFGSNEKHYSVSWVCAPTRSAMNITYWVVWTYTETSLFRWYASFSVSCLKSKPLTRSSVSMKRSSQLLARPEVNNTTLQNRIGRFCDCDHLEKQTQPNFRLCLPHRNATK